MTRRETVTSREAARIVGRLLLSIVVAAVLTFPLAVAWAINRTEVREQVGITPTTFSLSTTGRSELRLGVAGTVFFPIARGPFGVVATVEGPGDPDVGNGDLASYVSPEMLQLYTGLFHDPQPALDAYVDQLLDEFQHELLVASITLATAGGATFFVLSFLLPWRRKRGTRDSRVRLGAALALTLVGTTAVAIVQTRPAPEDERDQGVYALPALDGTLAEGSTTNSPVLRTLLGGATPKVQALIRRQDEGERAFRTLAEASLNSNATLMAGPLPGESAVLMQSDMHCNTSMIRLQRDVAELFKETFGEDALSLMAITGDLTTNGTAAEGACIQDIADSAGDTPIAAVTGNHESDVSSDQMNDAGMTVLNGSAEVGGLSVLGEGDPARSELFGVTKLRGDRTQTDVGQDLYEQAMASRADLVLVHEAYAAEAFIDVTDMVEFLDQRGGNTTPYDDGIRDLPAGAIFYGHWHRDVEPRVVWNSDGTWTLVMELGTAGGAIDTPSLERFSTPWSRPQQPATFPTIFLDDETGLVTGYQLYRFDPDGTVTIEPRISIGGNPVTR